MILWIFLFTHCIYSTLQEFLQLSNYVLVLHAYNFNPRTRKQKSEERVKNWTKKSEKKTQNQKNIRTFSI